MAVIWFAAAGVVQRGEGDESAIEGASTEGWGGDPGSADGRLVRARARLAGAAWPFDLADWPAGVGYRLDPAGPDDGAIAGAADAGEAAGVSETPDGVRQVICAAGYTWSCAKAVRVAECESGPDFWAPVGAVHAGTFQLAGEYHAWRFAARGWDYWTDGSDIVKNVAIAYEIWADQGWEPWPVCGLR